MKNLIKVSLLATGILTGFLSAVNAQTATTTTTPSTTTTAPAVRPHPGRKALLMRRAMMRHHIAKKLGLTSDQIAQLKAARTNTHAAIKAIRSNTSLTPDQKKAQIRDTLKTARAQMRAVLTPDQQTKLNHLRAKFRKAHRG